MILVFLLSSFRRCWSVFLFHRSKKKKKKKFVRERERDVAAEKRERFSFLVETSRTQIKHASSSHIITTGVLSSLRFSTTLFCDTTFRFRARQLCQKKSFLFLLFETRFTRVLSSIVNTISIFIQRTTSGERFFL